ncbi:lipopolysaccharide biosynthesis protein [Vibrio splendidus]
MIKNAAFWQSLSSVVNLILGILQVAILARILDASDFGVMAILMVIISISQVFSDFGMANYIVHKQKSTPELNSTIFWMCIAAGCTLCLGLSISSSLIASFYERPEIQSLLPLAAMAFIPISAMSQLQAQYTRTMRLVALAKIEVVSRVCATSSTVGIAFLGHGVESIIYGNLIFSSVKCLLVWTFSKSEWRPSFRFSMIEAKLAWQYGIYQIGSQLINQLRVNLDTIFLGFYLSNASLGYYSLAKQLISKPTGLILPVARKLALPLIAKAQKELAELNRLVAKAHVIVILFLMWPYSLFIILAPDITNLVYGVGYEDVAALLVPLSLFWLLRSVGGAIAGTLLQAMGKTKIDFYWNVVTFLVLAIICDVFSKYGALSLAWALFVLQCILLVAIYFVYFRSVISFPAALYFKPIVIFGSAAFIASLISYHVLSFLHHSIGQYIYLAIVIILSLILNYLLCWWGSGDMIFLSSPKKIWLKVSTRFFRT